MTMNKTIFANPTIDYKAFGTYISDYYRPEFRQDFSEKCKLINNEWSYWELVDSSAVSFGDNTSPIDTDITYRPFGSYRTCFRIYPYSDMATNTEKLTDPDLQGLDSNFFSDYFGSTPRITTNIENDIDQFIAIRADNPNRETQGDSIIVTQIDP